MPLLLKTIENIYFVSSHPLSYYTALKFNIIYRCKPLPLSVCLSLISFNHSTLIIIIIITTIPSHHQYRRLSLVSPTRVEMDVVFIFVLFVCFSIFPHFVLRNISFAACPILCLFVFIVILVFCLVVFVYLFYDFYLFEFFCSVILRFTRFLEECYCPSNWTSWIVPSPPFCLLCVCVLTVHHYHHHIAPLPPPSLLVSSL